MALFEALGCQGTNIVIANGIAAGQSVPHFGIEVVPRIADDKVGLSWEGKQLSEDDFEISLRALVEDITTAAAERVKAVEKKKMNGEGAVASLSTAEDGKEKNENVSKLKDKKMNSLVRSVRRIP